MDRKDVIVIGSGAGGLSAAITAATAGRSCLVLEAARQLGGYLNPFSRRGYTFDTGLHVLGGLGEEGSFRRMLDRLGVLDRVRFEPFDEAGRSSLLFSDLGYELRGWLDRAALRERLPADFPSERDGLHRFADLLDDVQRLMRAMSGPRRWVRMLALLPKLPRLFGTFRMTFSQLLDGYTRDPLLRAVLASGWTTYGLTPGRASAFYALAVMADLSGAFRTAGGSRAFVDALIARAREAGADLRNGCPVARVAKDGREFLVTTEAGETFRARAVVSNADPWHTYGRLLDPVLVPARLRDRVSRLRYSISMFGAYIGTPFDAPSSPLAGGWIGEFESVDLDGMFDRMTRSEDGVMLGAWSALCPSAVDPSGGYAPAGHHAVEVMCPAWYEPWRPWADRPTMRRGDEYEARKRRIGEQLVERVERRVPGLTRGAAVIEFSTPLTNESWVRAPFGACYGPDHGPDQVGPGRFAVRSHLPGLFLCGAGTMGGGVSPSMMTGVQAGEMAARF